MNANFVVLSALFVVLLVVFSPNLRQVAATGICLWAWPLCLLVSGVVGVLAGVWLGHHAMPGLFESGFLTALIFVCIAVFSASALTFFVYIEALPLACSQRLSEVVRLS